MTRRKRPPAREMPESVGEEVTLAQQTSFAVTEMPSEAPPSETEPDDDVEATVNVSGDMLPFPGRDDLDAPTVALGAEELEALVFASDAPIKPKELAKLADAPVKNVTDALADLQQDYATRGIHLEEVAGGWVFRTSGQFAPYVRDLTKQRPVRLSRAQVETLAIIAYRQPITRPEIDDVRGVDSGPVLKILLERDLVRILGKRDEVGRPLIYGTTNQFLEFFGLSSLKDLPTLHEFTELTEESRETYEEELGEPPNFAPPPEEPAPLDDADGIDPGEHTDVRESMAVPAHGDGDADPDDLPRTPCPAGAARRSRAGAGPRSRRGDRRPPRPGGPRSRWRGRRPSSSWCS